MLPRAGLLHARATRGAPVYETQGGRIGVAICYDRHYPEYMRALAIGGAELVVVPQAGAVGEWPEGLYEAEMRVAAFQNGYFIALCNRVGAEECLTFAGESFVCAPDGRVIARAGRCDRRRSSTPTWISRRRGAVARAASVPPRSPAGSLRLAGLPRRGRSPMKERRERLVGIMEAGVVRDARSRRRAGTALRGRGGTADLRRSRQHVRSGDAARIAREWRLAAATRRSVRAAYIGYIAYFGSYEIAADGASVVHHVEGALNPDWVGGKQVAQVRFDGARLVLSAEVRKNGEIVTHTLTWERC